MTFKVKARVVTFLVQGDTVDAEYDVRRSYFRTVSEDEAAEQLGVGGIPEEDARRAHQRITAQHAGSAAAPVDDALERRERRS